ncbi:hypothetical protein DPMN_005041 [Dreissena polymorpha]|uniref:Uncharacterized protein n=1 Tax=Dreissena polymorpha TaxID=45954 RepID=A0A9D4MSG8_DREPO|nr:hypothetical protein DPMN_005041 [Dreissena polymorpha]
MLDLDMKYFFRISVTLKVAFIAGSSKHGNAFRASVGSNWVTARYLQLTVPNNTCSF